MIINYNPSVLNAPRPTHTAPEYVQEQLIEAADAKRRRKAAARRAQWLRTGGKPNA